MSQDGDGEGEQMNPRTHSERLLAVACPDGWPSKRRQLA